MFELRKGQQKVYPYEKEISCAASVCALLVGLPGRAADNNGRASKSKTQDNGLVVTAEVQKLESDYTARLNAVKGELRAALPALGDKQKKDVITGFVSVLEGEKSEK